MLWKRNCGEPIVKKILELVLLHTNRGKFLKKMWCWVNTIQYNTIQSLLTLPEEGWSGWVGEWKIHSDEGLTLEKSALKSLNGAKLPHNLVNKTKYLFLHTALLDSLSFTSYKLWKPGNNPSRVLHRVRLQRW